MKLGGPGVQDVTGKMSVDLDDQHFSWHVGAAKDKNVYGVVAAIRSHMYVQGL